MALDLLFGWESIRLFPCINWTTHLCISILITLFIDCPWWVSHPQLCVMFRGHFWTFYNRQLNIRKIWRNVNSSNIGCWFFCVDLKMFVEWVFELLINCQHISTCTVSYMKICQWNKNQYYNTLSRENNGIRIFMVKKA